MKTLEASACPTCKGRYVEGRDASGTYRVVRCILCKGTRSLDTVDRAYLESALSSVEENMNIRAENLEEGWMSEQSVKDAHKFQAQDQAWVNHVRNYLKNVDAAREPSKT